MRCRLVEEKVWQTREECEQRKIAAMERTEHELAATKAALQASLARCIWMLGVVTGKLEARAEFQSGAAKMPGSTNVLF